MVSTIIITSIICTFNVYSNWNPQEYTASNDGQYKNGIKEIHKLALKGSESILDVGCGDGRLSHHIATTYIPQGTLLGIDSSQAMIEYAQSTFQAPNLSFTIGDISHYNSPQQFDAVVSFWTLHWVTPYNQALCSIAQLLKPHGKALLCHIVEHYPIDTLIEKLLNQPKWHAFKTSYVKTLHQPYIQEVIDAIKQSGLAIEHIEIKNNKELSTIQTVQKNLLSTPILASIPSSIRQEFCKDLFQEMVSTYILNKESIINQQAPMIIVLVLKKI